MNCLKNTRSLLSQIILRNKAPPAARCYHGPAAPQRLMQDLGSADIKAPCRRLSTSPRSFVLRWYHDPRKVAAATAITLSATVMAACSRYDREIIPCTYRSHLVVYSHQEERDLSDSYFAEHKAELVEKNMIVDPHDPRIARVRLVAERIVHAAHRGLGLYDSNDAPMLRVTQKRRRWGKARPNTSHLNGIKWEVTIAKDLNPNARLTPSGQILVTTGFLDRYKTDAELAVVLAHEVGHIIARQCADIYDIHWLLHNIFSRRREIEADYIGILLLGAAGFHPQWALVVLEKAAKVETTSFNYLNPKKRLQLLSEAKTMNEALELYREVIAMDKVTDRYFR
ncbi:hypothetical protein ACQ4PT_066087 [Festuca glaucescens]